MPVLMAIVPLIEPLPAFAFLLFFLMAASVVALAFSFHFKLVFASFLLVLAIAHGLARTSSSEPERALQHLSTKASQSSALVTGSTRGIGFEIARLLLKSGFSVFVHGRSAKDMKLAAEDLNRHGFPGQAITLDVGCDFASFDSTKKFAAALKKRITKIDLLISNAALLFVDPPTKTSDGFDKMMQVNVISPYLLEKLLAPERVVLVSSMSSAGAPPSAQVNADLTMPLENVYDDRVYGRTKLAQIALAEATNAVAVHPGGCSTGIQQDAMIVPFPFFHPWYWNAVVRPIALASIKQFWFHPSFCAEAVVWAAAFGKPTQYLGRFAEVPLMFRHELSNNKTFVKELHSKVEAVINHQLNV